ncbi:MAG: ISNCY family transposase [Candidatus Brocadia sp.]|nr:ISNCY family transposase [Candidatus Brocadia sp.]UJS19338.1 MAG: ISNCY family transposase [Candidatus Brocadia sp.]UJS20058.1 MAG: ISNCY family transposase [Candidatus Brocadia sp.]UJS20098.1 MAG: ISNCY family transposase [Candidatus Brocadia sp.]UJS20121.1 MAG: ISNCY family transposase [Candidatus Brocadia sp.]
MRKRFEQQLKLGIIPISGVKLPIKSRDELPPILRALQHIYVTPELNEEVFRILEAKVTKGKKKTGRYGMDLWHILVLSVVRLGLDADYDRLEDFANHHKLIRQIMGVETAFGEAKVFSMQSIKDNIRLLDEETLRQINEVVISSGHQLVKKKDEGLCIKVDTYVLETNVHFPTDMNLLWDAGRKSLDMIEDAIEEGILAGKGWRKSKYWRRELKKLMRISAKASSSGGKNKEEHVRSYLELSRGLSEKIGASLLAIYEKVLTTNQVDKHAGKIGTLEYFHGMLNKQIDLVERRVIRDEVIPAAEKVHSLFEPHTEWLYKGKSNKRVELGHNILVASDQWGFIVDHVVGEKQADVSLVIPLADRLLSRYGEGTIKSISFDKGFYKKENKELLSLYIPEVILPKKGKKNKAEQEEESGKTFKKLRHKHSAVESDINRLEHHGLDRCPDKGLHAFKRYCAMGVLAANLHKLGNVLQEKARKQCEKLRKAA